SSIMICYLICFHITIFIRVLYTRFLPLIYWFLSNTCAHFFTALTFIFSSPRPAVDASLNIEHISVYSSPDLLVLTLSTSPGETSDALLPRCERIYVRIRAISPSLRNSKAGMGWG